uniref:Uncharacterized protein n=1 Tax=Glossina austeni TaxID=7395 RepID=A0A1A9UHN0_GLOAU
MSPPPNLSNYLMAVRGIEKTKKRYHWKYSKTAQTDEEKQRDRQRSEREAKKEEQDALNYKKALSTTPSPQAIAGPPPPTPSVVAGPPATAAAATAAIIPILPLGVATLRDDSTESDQSVTCSQAQPDAYHRIILFCYGNGCPRPVYLRIRRYIRQATIIQQYAYSY